MLLLLLWPPVRVMLLLLPLVLGVILSDLLDILGGGVERTAIAAADYLKMEKETRYLDSFSTYSIL